MKNLRNGIGSEKVSKTSHQEELVDGINDQLIQIIPMTLEQGELIGKEFPGIKGFINKILGKKKAAEYELTHVQTSENEDFYLYPDGSPVYIKNSDGTNLKGLVHFSNAGIKFTGREICDYFMPFYTDTFQVINIIDDLGEGHIYRFSGENLGKRNCLQVGILYEKIQKLRLLDQNTGEVLKVGGEDIEYIDNDKKVELKDRIIQKVHLNEGGDTWIFTDTLEKVKIGGIEGKISDISFGKREMYKISLGPYHVMFVSTKNGKQYVVDIATMKVIKLPGINFDIDAEKLINNPLDRYSSKIKTNNFNIFQKEIFSIPLLIPHLKETNLPRDIAVYKETGLPVKVPGTELFVCGFDEVYTPDRAKIINGDRYGKAVILDTEEGRNYSIYLREGDLSILEATLLTGEKVMINNILDEDHRAVSIDGKEIIVIKYNKYHLSALVDKKTFQEQSIKLAGTDEEINMIRHHILNIGGQEIMQVGTKTGKIIYVYKKNLVPLQIPGVPGYVEDIKELEDGKRNMKIDGKWNVVRVK